jgi:hypothetical protein
VGAARANGRAASRSSKRMMRKSDGFCELELKRRAVVELLKTG